MENNLKPKGGVKKYLAWGCGGLLLIAIIGGIAGGASTKKDQPEKVGEVGNTSTVSPTTVTTQTYYLNDQVKLDDKVLTVYSVADYKSSNQFLQPKAGNKFVLVDLSLSNQGNEVVTINALEFKLQDNNNYSYNNGTSDKQPTISYDTIQPGRQVRGFITYEVPTNTNSYELIYTPSFFSNKQIVVKLQNK